MIAVPTLTTERLVLQPLTARHSAGMYEMWSSEAVCRYSGSVVDWNGKLIDLPASSAVESGKIIDFFSQMAVADLGFRWALINQRDGQFTGTVGFNALAPSAELAFHLVPKFWGKGLMREAASAAVYWIKVQRPDSGVEAFIDPENAASAGLAIRLGFLPTGDIQEGAERYLLT